jgi:hypothetical protein
MIEMNTGIDWLSDVELLHYILQDEDKFKLVWRLVKKLRTTDSS